MAAPALVSYKAASNDKGGMTKARLYLPEAATILAALAAGEMIADKLPGMPDRISPLALVARAGSGAAVGAAVSAAGQKSRIIGAVVGALAAVGSAYASYYLRRKASEGLGVADPVVALAEDALVIAGGLCVLQPLRSEQG